MARSFPGLPTGCGKWFPVPEEPLLAGFTQQECAARWLSLLGAWPVPKVTELK